MNDTLRSLFFLMNKTTKPIVELLNQYGNKYHPRWFYLIKDVIINVLEN